MAEFNPKKIDYIQMYFDYMLIKDNSDENEEEDKLLTFQYPNGTFTITKEDLLKKAQAEVKKLANKIKKNGK